MKRPEIGTRYLQIYVSNKGLVSKKHLRVSNKKTDGLIFLNW